MDSFFSPTFSSDINPLLSMTPNWSLARRARVACELCRKRKRRCNGASPCHLCQSMSIECRYQSSQRTPDIRSLTRRVESIERGLPPVTESQKASRSTVVDPYGHSCRCTTLSIPRAHSTTTASLLSMPEVRALLGVFPPGLFMDREISISNSFFDCTSLPPLDAESDRLVEAFFTHVHLETPILDEDAFRATYVAARQNHLSDEVTSALIYVILGLGSAVTASADEVLGAGEAHISAALGILGRHYLCSWRADISLAQGLLLAARLFGYRMQPLQSWKLVHMASTTVQQYFYLRENPSTDVSLLVWAIFDLESDLVAEHDLPRSGIEQLVETIALPYRPVHNSRSMLGWLAELSIRRLLNRVHGGLYGQSTHLLTKFKSPDDMQQAVANLLRTATELSHQLDSWVALLPLEIQPQGILSGSSQTEDTTLDLHALNVLLRYHSARDIIFRPFVIYACRYVNEIHFSPQFQRHCELWIANSRAYLRVSLDRLRWPCHFREIIMKSMLAVVVVLTLAGLSPALAELVSDIEDIQESALTAIYEHAIIGSCGSDLISILRSLQEKTRILKPRS